MNTSSYVLLSAQSKISYYLYLNKEDMNILFRMEKGIAVCLFSSFFVLACVNHIPGEKAAVSNGDIPLKFTADIHEVTYTRVAGNGFEENDEVGVFALVGSSTRKNVMRIICVSFVLPKKFLSPVSRFIILMMR